MNILSRGQAYQSDHGYAAFEPRKTYFFLHTENVLGYILFVHFEIHKSQSEYQEKNIDPTLTRVTAKLVDISTYEFMRGTSDGSIRRVNELINFPPWMTGQRVLMSHQDLGVPCKTNRYLRDRNKYEKQIEERLLAITPLNDAASEIFRVRSAIEAQRSINSIIRKNDPRANETRLRTWFLTYQIFGMNPAVLQHNRTASGRSRFKEESEMKKTGPVTKFSMKTNWRMTKHDKEMIIKGFRASAKIGSTLRYVYRESMRVHFGCTAKLVCPDRNSYEMAHPKGRRFPSFTTWYTTIKGRMDEEEITTRLKGKNMYRNLKKNWVGSFTENVANVYERIECDAEWVHARPVHDDGDIVLPPLVVAYRVDVLSGRKTGIGFDLGGETSQSYRVARLCEAIGLRKFSRLIGLNTTLLTDLDSIGAVGPDYLVDRGPGSSPAADSVDGPFKVLPMTKRIAPTASPQSKSVVENSHSRKVRKHSEGNLIEVSNLSVPELIKKLVIDLLAYNNSACKAGSLALNEVLESTVASPNECFSRYLCEGRNMGMPIPYDDAVRAFMEPHEARISLKGVSLSVHTYRTQNKHDDAIYKGLRKNLSRSIKAYVLPFAPLYIYCESGESPPRLIELKVVYDKLPSSDVEGLNLFESRILESKLREIKKDAASNADAMYLLAAEETRKAVGRSVKSRQSFSKQNKTKTETAKRTAIQIKKVTYVKKNR